MIRIPNCDARNLNNFPFETEFKSLSLNEASNFVDFLKEESRSALVNSATESDAYADCGGRRGARGDRGGGCCCAVRGGTVGPPSSTSSGADAGAALPSWLSAHHVKVAVIGAAGVGKSSLVKQFIHNENYADYNPTLQRATYHSSVILNHRVYQLTVVDIPAIKAFPQNSFSEWADYRSFGLRSANAYLFVFDLTCPETFTYIKTIRDQVFSARDQIAESRDLRGIGVVVVGNKRDLVTSQQDPRDKRDLTGHVRKHWKSAYVEVSAKYNWHVLSTFHELLLAIEEANTHVKEIKPHNLQDLHHVIGRSKCTIL